MTTTLNFVPIDYVVNGMVKIGGQPASAGGTYHLANPIPTPNDLWLPNICRLLGVTGVELVDESAFAVHPPTRMEASFQKQMAFYYMYLQGEPLFDCSHTLHGTGRDRYRMPARDGGVHREDRGLVCGVPEAGGEGSAG
jgi:hypothetical protein